MLDEPLGSLDAALRERLVIDLQSIIKRLGLTAIYVTHDQSEAFAIADRIAVMNAGRIEQIGTPEAVYFQPQTAFVARFLGLDNVLPITRGDGTYAETPVGVFDLPVEAENVLVHPRAITLADAASRDSFRGEVIACVFAGDVYRVNVRHGVVLSFNALSRLQIGENVVLHIDPSGIVPLYASSRPGP
jgi:ABC-type Fe3+/spermidine/putrescine transport system ATPase subunit